MLIKILFIPPPFTGDNVVLFGLFFSYYGENNCVWIIISQSCCIFCGKWKVNRPLCNTHRIRNANFQRKLRLFWCFLLLFKKKGQKILGKLLWSVWKGEWRECSAEVFFFALFCFFLGRRRLLVFLSFRLLIVRCTWYWHFYRSDFRLHFE